MKELFVTKVFGADAQAIIDKANGILAEYAGQGYTLTLRQLYYQLVSRGYIANNIKSYKRIGSIISDGRLAGLIDWDHIEDREREVVKPPSWESPGELLEAAAAQFRIDKWENQPSYLEVMVEKTALEGILRPVCRQEQMAFTANKGYSSSSAMYEAAARLRTQLEAGKEVHVLYLGDHDPSGIDMTRDVRDRLTMFMGNVDADCYEDDDGKKVIAGFFVDRLALNMAQVEEMRPPENPAKITDSRAKSYIAEFGRSSWELDAIEPRELSQLVTDFAARYRDNDLWDVEVGREQTMQAAILAAKKTLPSI